MKLLMLREESKDGATLSKLYDGSHYVCDILEDVVREIPGRPVSEWKIKGQTAIPAGVYKITFENSPRFGKDTLTVNDVPGYVGVRIHAGNKSTDTEGCLLPGLRNSSSTVLSSRVYLQALKNMCKEVVGRGQLITLEIKNHESIGRRI